MDLGLRSAMSLDADGYPEEQILADIRKWEPYGFDDLKGLMDVLRAHWWHQDWGWSENQIDQLGVFERPGIRYHVSTGGWSGNESLIYALQSNYIAWHLLWVQTRRGGHYVFELEKKEKHAVQDDDHTTNTTEHD